MDKPNTDPQLNDEVNERTESSPNPANHSPLDNEDPGYAVNYGRTIGNHHQPIHNVETQNYIDHVSEPVNNTYV